jgi:outer membrane protein assembly factor BamB
MTVKVTLPDRTTTTLGPFTSDDTGGTSTSYTPAVTGNYTFVMTFPGQTLAGNNPPVNPAGIPYIGDYFEPSNSNVFTLTVQQQPVGYPPVTPLPTDYWTRPIYAENTNWYSIAGNWLGLGMSEFATTGMYNSSTNYNPYTTAPTTGHILWTKPEAFGGIIGGEFGGSETSNYYSTSQYEPKFAPIIMQGILYYTMYPGSSTYPAGWAAVDLQTGQTLWTKNTTETLLCGQILNYQTPNQYGGLAYLWSEPSDLASLEMWDAMTGDYVLSVNANPTTMIWAPFAEDTHGDLLIYYINYTDNTLNMWNSTACINLAVGNYAGGPNVANNWMWRPPLGAVINFSLGIEWSIPLPTEFSGNSLITNGLYWMIEGMGSSNVILLADYPSISYEFNYGWQIEAGYSMTNGAQLWITNRTETPYTIVEFGSEEQWDTMGSGVYAEVCETTHTLVGYSLTTGKEMWGPITLPNVSPFASLGMGEVPANGTLYIWDYGGDVYAINILTGALKWQYHTPSGGYESPYGTEPLWVFSVATVAGGELFVPEGHMYSPPLFHGAQQLALNITNGQLVWSELAFDVTSAPAVSDGIMTTLNAYDNQIYAWGVGPSETSVTAPDIGVTTATPVTITGTVMDISAGSQQNAVAANFPHGLPCVSDASMSPFMEAVYMQQPMPNNLTGVPVTLSVTDSNGNHYNIGTAITNPLTGFYSLTWTPVIPGNFTVTATFAGTQSYYGSYANTAFYASPAASTPAPTASPVSGLASTTTVMDIGVAIIIVIVICVAVLAVLMMRKRP